MRGVKLTIAHARRLRYAGRKSLRKNYPATRLSGVNGLKSVHSPATMTPSQRSMSVALARANQNSATGIIIATAGNIICALSNIAA